MWSVVQMLNPLSEYDYKANFYTGSACRKGSKTRVLVPCWGALVTS